MSSKFLLANSLLYLHFYYFINWNMIFDTRPENVKQKLNCYGVPLELLNSEEKKFERYDVVDIFAFNTVYSEEA